MLVVQRLCKEYLDPKTSRLIKAVDDVSFDVSEGEVFAFLGKNGAGKTTTIQMLTTLVRPTSGSILIDGIDPITDPYEVRRRIGIVFQEATVDTELSIYENMDLHGVLYHVPARTRRERIGELLESFELWDRRNSMVSTISGGMRRRLEIARGLLHTPRVLFLDEPTIGLDPQSRQMLWNRIEQMNRIEKVTVFLTTHYLEEAERVASRVAIMDNGRIVAQGTVQALRSQTGSESLERAFIKLVSPASGEGRSPAAKVPQDTPRRQGGGRG